jgi:gamma-glutamylcyclotransferase (GGCT)/AIG2-like uncharacterized protein YtfP
MTDVYSNAIEQVCEYYNITKEECVEYYWDEVEAWMYMMNELLRKQNP